MLEAYIYPKNKRIPCEGASNRKPMGEINWNNFGNFARFRNRKSFFEKA